MQRTFWSHWFNSAATFQGIVKKLSRRQSKPQFKTEKSLFCMRIFRKIFLKNKRQIKAAINSLSSLVLRDDRTLSELIGRLEDGTEVDDLPEFLEPEIIVPMVCRKQMLLYLKSKLAGMTNSETIVSILLSRYEKSANPTEVHIDSFKNILDRAILKKELIHVQELCEEILTVEERLEENPQLKDIVFKIVEQFFSNHDAFLRLTK